MISKSACFEKIEKIHNKLSDSSFVWFPFLFLRPETTAAITVRLRLFMAILFGTYYGFFYSLQRSFLYDNVTLEPILRNIGLAIGVFFIWFTFVTAPLWNRRAQRLLRTFDS